MEKPENFAVCVGLGTGRVSKDHEKMLNDSLYGTT
jgi:hypothetical protein